jgi:hypothetical protein
MSARDAKSRKRRMFAEAAVLVDPSFVPSEWLVVGLWAQHPAKRAASTIGLG